MSGQLIAMIASLSTVLAALFKVLAKVNAQQREFEETKTLARKNDETGKILIKANIAILEGLKQQGCDGRVDEMHRMLIAYAVDK